VPGVKDPAPAVAADVASFPPNTDVVSSDVDSAVHGVDPGGGDPDPALCRRCGGEGKALLSKYPTPLPDEEDELPDPAPAEVEAPAVF
jgi:hypothetical protein